MLKNRKFMGKIQEQYIRTKSKPLIAEVGGETKPLMTSESSHQDVKPEISSPAQIKLVLHDNIWSDELKKKQT